MARLLVALCAFVLVGAAAEPDASLQTAARQVSAGIYEIGKVRVDARARTVAIPAQINMLEGAIEYVLVSALGKLHESILKTDAEPMHIQAAALLLLAQPPSSNKPASLRIDLELPNGKTIPADSSVLDAMTNKTLPPADWSYIGSRIVEGSFLAQRDGSIISIVADPDSLIQSGRINADDDDRWRPAKTDLPAIGTPVKVILKFPEAKKSETTKRPENAFKD